MSTLLDELVREMVAEAREEGHSWADIADALGVSRQAAQQRIDRPEAAGGH